MTKNQHVANPILCQTIREFGIRWKANQYWEWRSKQGYVLTSGKEGPFSGKFAAYDMAELGKLIPFGFFNQMKIRKYLNNYFQVWIGEDDKGAWETYVIEVDCRARYLCWLLESKKATVADVRDSSSPVMLPKTANVITS